MRLMVSVAIQFYVNKLNYIGIKIGIEMWNELKMLDCSCEFTKWHICHKKIDKHLNR